MSPVSNKFKNELKQTTKKLKRDPEMAPKRNELGPERFQPPPHIENHKNGILKSIKRLSFLMHCKKLLFVAAKKLSFPIKVFLVFLCFYKVFGVPRGVTFYIFVATNHVFL